MQLDPKGLVLRLGAFYVGMIAGTAALIVLFGLIFGVGLALGFDGKHLAYAAAVVMVSVPVTLLALSYRRR